MPVMPELRYTTPSGELGDYLATPSDAGPHPGVAVIQDALGLSDDIRAQAGHSFLNHLKVGPLTPLLHVTGFGYNREAAEDAWRRILAFFGEHLS